MIWLTADLHLGHDRMAREYRGFSSVEEHDEAVMAAFDRVSDRDEVWILGDLALGMRRYAAFKKLSEAPGAKHLVLGNHDRAHPSNPNGHNQVGDYLVENGGPFTSVSLHAELRGVLLSHFPYDGDTDGRDEDRYVEWRLRDTRKPLIHGHTHSRNRLTLSWIGTPQLHVGLDAWDFSLVPLRVALEEMSLPS